MVIQAFMKDGSKERSQMQIFHFKYILISSITNMSEMAKVQAVANRPAGFLSLDGTHGMK